MKLDFRDVLVFILVVIPSLVVAAVVALAQLGRIP